ncbi:MAG: SDR family NAD(P)-dependent oxidoreductase [Chloroflexi bacterium]|nr:SDR family NAD(P)-dependent oxidoreductase [Chloroflexota bacterium]
MTSRTILITGASRGIGAAAARAFARYPVCLGLLARSQERLVALAEELNQNPNVEALPLVADVSVREEVEQAVAQLETHFGAVDILVNNAGVGMRSPVGAIDMAKAHLLFEINFWGAIHVIEAVLPGMEAQRDGLIINISSIIGRRAMPNAGIYCASKFALNAISEAMRLELRGKNIRVVTFYPGVTDTDMTKHELTGDATHESRGKVRRTPVEVTARAIVRAAQREPRDAYATLFDRVFVLSATLFPALMDRMLARFYRARDE